MSLRRTLLLALLAGVLGGYIWLVERPRIAVESEPDKLLVFEPEHVSRLRLVAPTTPALTLERTEQNWRLTEPLHADADDEVVGLLLEQIAKSEATRRIAMKDAEPLSTYGLDGDGTQARVSITLDDGKALPDVVIGSTTPVGYEAFARVEGRDEIILVPLLLHSGIKKSAFDLREKKLFAVDPTTAIAVKLSWEGATISLQRDGDRWQITGPIANPADSAQIETLLNSLNELSALAFYDNAEVDDGTFGLSTPVLEFETEIGGTGAVGFKLGEKSTEAPVGYYLQRLSDGQVAKVAEWAHMRFAKNVASLRDKHLFDCEAAEIGKITYERADGTGFSLAIGEDGKWRMEPAPARALQDAVVERIRSGLASLAGTEVVAENADTSEELAGFRLDTPAVEVELATRDGRSCGRALAGVVGPESESPAYYLKRSDASLVMSAPAYLYSRLNMVASDFLVPETPREGAEKAAEPPPGTR